jgi:hypothetical protein
MVKWWSAEDSLPAAQLVELAFSAFASMWPTIARSRGEDVDGVLDSIARHLDAQMEELESMSKKINAIERMAITIQREAVGIRKIRDSVGSIDQVRLQYPQLTAREDEHEGAQPVEGWESEPGKALLAAIESFKSAKKGRYPKHMGDLELDESVLTFASNMPNALEKAVAMVKSSQTRKRARVE